MYNSKEIEIATKTYFWKPMAALFRSLEMRLYYNSGLILDGPVLDLGCGDGGIVQMLDNVCLLEKPLCGLDLSYNELVKAKRRETHLNIMQADACCLPFMDESFSSIICNGVLCSIPTKVEQPLKEISRLLKDDGVFVATVPTDMFIDVLIIPRILKKLSPVLSSMYVERLNNRLPHFNTFSPESWIEKIEEHGLRVICCEMFFSTRVGIIWNILSMQMFRVFGILKLINNKTIIWVLSNLLEMIIKILCKEELPKSAKFGYMFLIAKKRRKLKNIDTT